MFPPAPAAPPTPNRQILSDRRAHELIDFIHANRAYTAGSGRFADGRLAEIFLNTGKSGTDVENAARDAAIVASIALQHGTPAEIIRHALTRNRDGGAAGPLGTLLDLIVPKLGGASL
jgi:hypothetical protein